MFKADIDGFEVWLKGCFEREWIEEFFRKTLALAVVCLFIVPFVMVALVDG